MAKYVPPKQSTGGQIFDVLLIVVLIFVTLWLPIWLGLAGADKTYDAVENPSWEALGQNEVMAATWEQLGYTVESAEEIISSHYNYTIDWFALIVLGVALLGYFVFLFRVSDKEYREVIREKFEE